MKNKTFKQTTERNHLVNTSMNEKRELKGGIN